MHPNQPRQPIRRDQIILAIGAVQEATRPNWPKRGEIVITDKNTGRLCFRSIPVFSVEGAREQLKTLIKANGEILTSDDATAIETKARDELKVPHAMTRFDRLFRTRPAEEATTLTDFFTGTRPAEEGMGATTFIACTGQCDYENCQRYPKHGALRIAHANAIIAPVTFSTARAEEVLKAGVETGLIEAEEVPTLERQIREFGLFTTETPSEPDPRTRADRIIANGQPWGELLLDETFGLRKPDPESGKLHFCGACNHAEHRHVHFNGRYPALSHPGGMYTAFQANQAIEELVNTGVIDETTASLLRGEIERYELPAGNAEDPLNAVAKRDNDLLLSMIESMTPLVALSTLMDMGDPQAMGLFGSNGGRLRIAFGFGGFGR